MPATSGGRYRVFASPRDRDEWLFVDVGDPGDPDREFEPTYVPRSGHGDLDPAVEALEPGYLVAATVEWTETPRIADLEVQKRTLFEFVENTTTVFQAARECWAGAATAGEAMNSQVTYDTDGQANGVLYVFADQPQGLFEEFRSGVRPLEPLIERVNENHEGHDTEGSEGGGSIGLGPEGIRIRAGDEDEDESEDDRPEGVGPDREVFVVDPDGEPFVIVYIALRKGGLLSETMRETYGLVAPEA